MMIAQNHNEQGQWKPLQRWGVVVVEGEDAGTFLQGQLTHHIQNLASNTLQMAGFCTAKGRLLGNFWVFCPPSPTQTIFWLLCRADIIPALIKRLNMFVLRSKCKVMDGRPHIQVLLEENNANHNVENHFQNNNDEFRFNINWGYQHDGMHHATVVLNSNFMLHLVSSTDISTTTIPAEANSADDAFETYWTQRGLGFIQAQTVESFTPQAINLDLVGGVSFNKGCYPGQEVVARTHYLGKIKRRAVLCQVMQTEINSTLPATWATECAGMDVWASTQNREPIGQIIQMAFDGNGHWALVELPLELLSENIQWTVRAKQSSIEQNNTDSMPQAELCSLLPKPELLPYSLSGKGNPFE